MSTRPYIKRVFGRIVTETPYDRLWVDAIKYVVPASDRKYEAANVWSFSPAYYSCVLHICDHFYGSKIIDSTGGVPEPQTSGWKERWDVWKTNQQTRSEHRQRDERQSGQAHAQDDFDDQDANEAFYDFIRNFNRGGQKQRQAPQPTGKLSNAYATLFVTLDAPGEVITGAWRALNNMYRKDDPDGTKNHEVLTRINGAYAELKKIGKVK